MVNTINQPSTPNANLPSKPPIKNNFQKSPNSQVIYLVITILLVVFVAIGLYMVLGKSKEETQDEPESITEQPQITHGPENIFVEEISSNYEVASGETSGTFQTGQAADIMLSGINFNNTGGGLLFNHPKGIASDGTHLLLADTNNNRILIWNSLPTENTEPDIVLGQENFTTNEPGTGMDGLNWPVGVATDGQHVIVADTYNDRILIWNNFPTENKQPANLILENENEFVSIDQSGTIAWPWAVWTNGEKLIVTSTMGKQVLIWNQIPTSYNRRADIALKLNDFGTPRTIGSDGNYLCIGDHNAYGDNVGNFFWKSFPTYSYQQYDFFMSDPASIGEETEHGSFGYHMGSAFTPDGEFLMISNDYLALWDAFPEGENDSPDIVVGKRGGGPIEEQEEGEGYEIQDGDGSGMVFAGGKLYLSLSNANKVVVFNGLPTSSTQRPDFAIGSPDIDTNTLETNYFMTNPVPATDSKSLFVSSDFDQKLYVWKSIPDESGAKPDLIYHNVSGWDNALYGDVFALAGRENLYIWEELPTEGNFPDKIFRQTVGEIQIQEIKGVALDENYFYLSDSGANKVYVWEGLPDDDKSPKFTLNIEQPKRLSSDGEYLAVTAIFDHSIQLYLIDDLSDNARPVGSVGGHGKFNLPQGATVSNGSLFVGDTGYNRVFVWEDIDDAIAGSDADVILGASDKDEVVPELAQDKLFWPAVSTFDGNYLWIGEFKFSGRLLRYSPSE